jgi:hypothetical protein
MPYKDKGKQREAQRSAMRRKRGSHKGSQPEGSQRQGSHNVDSAAQTNVLTKNGTFFKDGIEYVPASYVPGSNGKEWLNLPERERYLTLTDGQVLDRANPPARKKALSGAMIQTLQRANDSAFGFIPRSKGVPAELMERIRFNPA